MKSPAHRDLQIDALRDAGNVHRADAIAVEEPLEIRLRKDGAEDRAISITMRTPGSDSELALGFLHGEGLIHAPGHDFELRRLRQGVHRGGDRERRHPPRGERPGS